MVKSHQTTGRADMTAGPALRPDDMQVFVTCPTLSTPRLILRPMTTNDNTFLCALLCDDKTRQYLGGAIPQDRVSDHIAGYHKDAKAAPHWTVRQTRRPIGLISLTAHKDGSDTEISYQFLAQFWGDGFATEAATAVLTHAGKVMPNKRIIAETQARNLRSIALLERLGMVKTDQLHRFGAEQHIYATKA